MLIPLVGGVDALVTELCASTVSCLTEQAACGEDDPSPACHVVEQAVGTMLHFLHSKVAPERPVLGVKEFRSVGASEVVSWLRR